MSLPRSDALLAIAIEREWHDLRKLEREANMKEWYPEGGNYEREAYLDRQRREWSRGRPMEEHGGDWGEAASRRG